MINYIKGDATNPEKSGNVIIAHICNDIGAWGRGFVMSLSKQYPMAETYYRLWANKQEKIPFELGQLQLVEVEPNVWVANMIAQNGILNKKRKDKPIRYEALEMCLNKLNMQAKKLNASIHMPRIGCGLAGGKWSIIEPIIEKCLENNVFIYDLEK